MRNAGAGRQKGTGKARSAQETKKGKVKKGSADSSQAASDNEDIEVDIDDAGADIDAHSLLSCSFCIPRHAHWLSNIAMIASCTFRHISFVSS